MSFVHLHVHSCYSLLDGAIKIPDMVKTAKDMNMPAVALTDHGQMFGILPFYKEALKAGVKPILGVEAYVTNGDHRSRIQGEVRHHLVLLAESNEGYQNLCRLVSRANIEGFYYRPRMDIGLLRRYNKGIIALSACLKGEVPWLLLNRGEAEGRQAAEELASIFKDRFYLELQHNALPEQDEANAALIELAHKASLPLVATNDCHYLLKEHHDMHDVLLCIQTGKTVDDEKRMRFTTREFHFKSPQEMAANFSHIPEALANTLAIAERCNVEFPKKYPYAFPAIKLEAGENSDDRMVRFSREGLQKRFKDKAKAGHPFSDEDQEKYRARLEEEIALIIQMGFSSYFLIVADFINWAKDHGIPVGPGRGSAAGSLVAYAMSITDVDPIRFDLLFERFLNPERISMPDIDVDFCTDGRDEVIRYVTENYGGKEQVSQIITFGQMKAKAVIRDVGRALGLGYGEVDKIAKLVPNKLNITLNQAIQMEPKIREEAQANPKVAKLLEYALLLEGLPRHASTHAAGVVIGDRPLMEHLPLYCDPSTEEKDGEKTQVITQADMKHVESIGLIKFDFLGLKTLTLINQCLALLEPRGIRIDLQNLDFEDKKTYELLGRADTTGVFQLESSGMREILVKLKPSCLDDLMGLVALYRPGPLGSGMVDTFIGGKHGKGGAQAELPQLEPILKETYGVILYQEQVMRISQVLANYSLGEADLLRRAMGKKDAAEMAKQKNRFMDGAKENKIDLKKAEHIFELMAKFAEYGFNKSHSAAYAIVAFQTAYLKAHYPVEFVAALMTSEKDNQEKVVRLIGDCRASGIAVMPPDVNESGYKFTVAGNAIRFGLAAIKGLGAAAIEAIIEARKDGPFTSLYDFCDRVDTQKVNRRVIESLIKCGAFDQSGGADRAVMVVAVGEALEASARTQRDRRDGQSNMFDLLAETTADQVKINWPKADPWRENIRLGYEKEFLGFFITGHPLASHEMELKIVSNTTADNLKNRSGGSEVRLGGVVEKVTTKLDKKGNKFAFVTVEDMSGSVEVIVWSKTYEAVAEILVPEKVVVVSGRVENEDRSGQAAARIIANDIVPLAEALGQKTEFVSFKVPHDRLTPDMTAFFKSLIARHPGSAKTRIHLLEQDGMAIYQLEARIKPSSDLIEAVRRELGENSLELR